MNNLTSSHPPIVITVYPSNSSSSDIVWKIERKRISLKKLKKVKNRFSLLWHISAVDDALHVIILTRTSFEVNEVASFLLGAKVPCIRLRSRSIPTLSHGNERGAILFFFFLPLIRKSPSQKWDSYLLVDLFLGSQTKFRKTGNAKYGSLF